jgi:hypothetical protein
MVNEALISAFRPADFAGVEQTVVMHRMRGLNLSDRLTANPDAGMTGQPV